jgi:hypothetical protein
MATHAPAELRWAAQELAAAAREAGLEPAADHYATERVYDMDDGLAERAA